jgi:SAM-dependent methyltransferase
VDARAGAYEAYQTLAEYYDDFTAGHCHDRWVARLEAVARTWGLSGRNALDLACGTGRSFLPLIDRDYHVTACDLSPAMVRGAAAAADGRATTLVADMRSVPALGQFDLVTCLDDAVNYLLAPDDLRQTFLSVARNLAPGGLLVFDTNSLRTYRTSFAVTGEAHGERASYRWIGEGSPYAPPGSVSAAAMEIRAPARPVVHSRHVQRHYTAASVVEAAAAAGLRCLAAYGQSPGARLDRAPRELEHTKVVYVCGKA